MKQDLLFETWCKHKYGTITPTLTRSERGRINRALKELREVNATPEDMLAKIKVYEQKFKGCELTITALAANWNSLKVVRVQPKIGTYQGPPEVPLAERQRGFEELKRNLPRNIAARMGK